MPSSSQSYIDDSNQNENASLLTENIFPASSSDARNNRDNSESIRTKPKRKKTTAQVVQIVDAAFEQVKKEFLFFLNNFRGSRVESTSNQSQASQGPSQGSRANLSGDSQQRIGTTDQSDFVSQVAMMAQDMTTTLYVSVNDLMLFNQELAIAVIEEFVRFEPAVSAAVQEFVRVQFPEHLRLDDRDTEKKMFVAFTDLASVHRIRELKTSKLGQLISVSGTATRTTEVRPELLEGGFSCKDCASIITRVEQQFVYTEPVRCTNANCDNKSSWGLEMTESYFVDWQRVRMQENVSEIPAGSMPRNIDVILRNEIVEKIKPGDKCVFTGTLIVVPDLGAIYGGVETAKVGGKKPNPTYQGVVGVQKLGVKSLSYKLVFLANNAALMHKELSQGEETENDGFERELVLEEMSEQEKHDILTMSETPNIYSRLAESIAPSIYGHSEIKKGILLMLLGGVHKVTFDGIKLRGDINVCIVGDPSTAKSQFLKFVCSFLPRSVYTSGKASSAAGLTASVVRDPETNEFGIEAGALMLADNGICCIDEFDKMDEKDQAAIHEAMEQQTISVTKAGISATLNARTSILAAANPIFGRYDLSRTLRENIDISEAIMSRFDLFFVITDVCDEVMDYNMARHIVSVHQHKEQTVCPPYELPLLHAYIRYARTIKPQMSSEATKLMTKEYKELRQADCGGTKSAYRITVRQLESLIRLSEALARAELKDIILERHVKEAARLLKKSIIPIQNEDVDLEEELYGETTQDDKGQEKIRESGKTLSFEEYTRLSNLFIHHIRRSERQSDEWKGMTEKDLLDWYLEQGNESGLFVGEESAAEALDIAKAVINRLIKTDNVLIVIEEPDLITEENRGQRVIDVHPNFDPETNEIEVTQTQSQTQSHRENKESKRDGSGDKIEEVDLETEEEDSNE